MAALDGQVHSMSNDWIGKGDSAAHIITIGAQAQGPVFNQSNLYYGQIAEEFSKNLDISW